MIMLGKRNIFLIGPMGSGKTAVGRHLARLFHLTFHDSDADIEAKTGVDIQFIFEKEGEAGFRIREKESIDRLTRLESIVLATGGGAVIDPARVEGWGRLFTMPELALPASQIADVRRGAQSS